MLDENALVSKVIDMLREFPDFINKLSKDKNKHPMIIQGNLAPSSWDIKDTSCIIYTVDNRTDTDYANISLRSSCRAATYLESRDLANAMVSALNRKGPEGFFVMAEPIMTLPPLDGETDNFNTPVQITVRAR